MLGRQNEKKEKTEKKDKDREKATSSWFTAKRILRELAPSHHVIASATHNLSSLFRKKVLSGTGIENLGIQAITKKLTNIPAKFEKKQNRMKIFFPAGYELARRFIQGKQDNHKGNLFPLQKKLYNYTIGFVQKLVVNLGF